MLAIIDSRSPKKAIDNLGKYVDDIFMFKTKGITYNSISCHPDIFIFQYEDNYVLAPNSPDSLQIFLDKHGIKFSMGTTLVDDTLKNSTAYNCVSTKDFLFHKSEFSDYRVKEICSNKKIINLPQAYTRCSMINLENDLYLTSDRGIEKILKMNDLDVFFFSPEDIRIFDHNHGFIGGTCGTYENMIFFNGNILKHKDGKFINKFIESADYEIISLHDDFLYDGGGLFIL